MMKRYGLYIVISIVGLASILGVNTTKGRINEIDVKKYIGKSYKELPKELNKKGIEIKFGENGEIVALLINCKNYYVDHISVGDEIEKIYEVYPKEWMNKGEHTIKISYGQDSHYGVATDCIIYVLGKNEKVQSIIIGKTAAFIEAPLPKSNAEAKGLLQGKWQSEDQRVIEFNESHLIDSYMEQLWDKQVYTIISPNQLFISRQKEDQQEKLFLYFWFDNNKLYLFTINENGMPIQESIEIFLKL